MNKMQMRKNTTTIQLLKMRVDRDFYWETPCLRWHTVRAERVTGSKDRTGLSVLIMTASCLRFLQDERGVGERHEIGGKILFTGTYHSYQNLLKPSLLPLSQDHRKQLRPQFSGKTQSQLLSDSLVKHTDNWNCNIRRLLTVRAHSCLSITNKVRPTQPFMQHSRSHITASPFHYLNAQRSPPVTSL